MAEFWNRAEAKRRAKESLRRGAFGKGLGVRFIIFGITLLYTIVVSAIQSVYYLVAVRDTSSVDIRRFRDIVDLIDRGHTPGQDDIAFIVEMMTEILPSMLILAGVIILIGLLVKILLLNPLEVGSAYWFSRNREMAMPPMTEALWQPFRDGRYGNSIAGMFWRDLWLFIWSLPALALQAGLLVYIYFNTDLLSPILDFAVNEPNMPLPDDMINRLILESYNVVVVVGIVAILMLLWSIVVIMRHYSYRLDRFLLADNPQMGSRKALTLSRQLMQGNKGKLFALDLSFIGYWLLVAVTAVLAPFTAQVLRTYMEACYAEFYACIREDGVKRNLFTMEDLGYQRVAQ